MGGSGFSFFDGCAVRWVHLSPCQEECTSSSNKIYICGSISNSQSPPTEISKTGDAAEVKIIVEQVNTVRHLKA